MLKKYQVVLSEAERKQLLVLVRKGKSSALRQTRARILLQADSGTQGLSWSDAQIHQALGVAISTIERTRLHFVQDGLEAALSGRASSRHYERILDGEAEAHLVALACSEPPEGHVRWTLRLLAHRMVELEYCDALSYETVRRTLKKTHSSRG